MMKKKIKCNKCGKKFEDTFSFCPFCGKRKRWKEFFLNNELIIEDYKSFRKFCKKFNLSYCHTLTIVRKDVKLSDKSPTFKKIPKKYLEEIK
jgi:uncharacterized OB-fold protein